MRLRENSYGINTATKFKILQSNNITKDDSKKKENYEQLEEYAGAKIAPGTVKYDKTVNKEKEFV